MKRIALITSLILAVLTLSACDTLNNLVQTPPADYTGTYADLDVNYGYVCGLPRTGEIHLSISTQIVEEASLHTINAAAVIFDAGADAETLTHKATWNVPGTANNLNSGALDDFGTVTLKKDGNTFTGVMSIHNIECVTPAPEPGQPDITTYARVTVPFTAKAH